MTALPPLPRPWYRELWPWLLMLPPAASVLGGVTLLSLAVREPAALVVEDYSQIETLTADRFARDQRASELALRADVAFKVGSAGDVDVEVELSGGERLVPPAALVMRLAHATRAVGDRELVLARSSARDTGTGAAASLGGARYTGATSGFGGRYRVELEPAGGAWRLAGRLSAVPSTLRLQAQPGPDR